MITDEQMIIDALQRSWSTFYTKAERRSCQNEIDANWWEVYPRIDKLIEDIEKGKLRLVRTT